MDIVANRNRRVGALAGLLVAAMVALGFASSPLYRIFCQATGFNGTTQRSEEPAPGAIGKIISVRFDANVDPRLKWKFAPEEASHRVAIGARQMAFFNATNLTDHPITGRAVFNVTPEQAGGYFVKIQCFCFDEQTLQPGETARMPVVYYVDPGILKDSIGKDISEITLSYTFYEAADSKTKDVKDGAPRTAA